LRTARQAITDPERVALVDEAIETEGRYIAGMQQVVELMNRRDQLVYEVLNPTGLQMRNAITEINQGAYRDGDYVSANTNGR
jgi:hypothetical protein